MDPEVDVDLDDLNVDFLICFAIFTALSRVKIVCKGIFSCIDNFSPPTYQAISCSSVSFRSLGEVSWWNSME